MKPCSSFSATQTPWPLAPTRAASLGAPHRTLARSAAASPACRRGHPHPRRTLQTPRRLHELLVRAAGPRGVIAAPATRLPAATAGGCSAAPTAVDTHRHRSGGQISCLPSNSRVCRFAEQAASSANGGCCLPSNRSAARGSRSQLTGPGFRGNSRLKTAPKTHAVESTVGEQVFSSKIINCQCVWRATQLSIVSTLDSWRWIGPPRTAEQPAQRQSAYSRGARRLGLLPQPIRTR